jgi:uncharacterized protein YdhG (YjbR/CyaY superfamily)
MNMFKATKATTVEQYLANVPEERREIINFLHKFIQDSAPELKVHFAYNMIGYGTFKYKNYKKQDAEWPIIALANQKNYVSVYICAISEDEYLADKFKDSLGRVSVGKSCIRFKKLEDINTDVLKKVIKLAVLSPGLITSENKK